MVMIAAKNEPVELHIRSWRSIQKKNRKEKSFWVEYLFLHWDSNCVSFEQEGNVPGVKIVSYE